VGVCWLMYFNKSLWYDLDCLKVEVGIGGGGGDEVSVRA